MKRRRFLLAALALVLVIAAGSVYWFWLRGADETIATITLDGEVIAEYDLSQVRETEMFTVGAPGRGEYDPRFAGRHRRDQRRLSGSGLRASGRAQPRTAADRLPAT